MTAALTQAWVGALAMPALFIGHDRRIMAANNSSISVYGEEVIGRNYTAALRQPAAVDAFELCFKDRSENTVRIQRADGGNDKVFDLRCAYIAEGADGVLATLNDFLDIE